MKEVQTQNILTHLRTVLDYIYFPSLKAVQMPRCKAHTHFKICTICKKLSYLYCNSLVTWSILQMISYLQLIQRVTTDLAYNINIIYF